MSNPIYYICCAVLIGGVLLGISLLSKVKTARLGNTISACCMALAILVTMLQYQLISLIALWICVAIGLVLGLIGAAKIKMIEMPQAVALLNGFGGAASALVAVVFVINGLEADVFSYATAGLALAVGWVTFSGSAIAAAKLHKLIDQRPVIWQGHQKILIATMVVLVLLLIVLPAFDFWRIAVMIIISLFSLFFGVAFAIRVGGADMPITISLLNSLSGVAGSIAGMVIAEPLLVAVGGVVGASGIILTQIMCRGMNRSLSDILMGKTSISSSKQQANDASPSEVAAAPVLSAAAAAQKKAAALAAL
ncbi:MAG: NAD(P)(+) transhydrogenase (Re/Si-specific) subunit beta, partial [Clostridiales bacterium]